MRIGIRFQKRIISTLNKFRDRILETIPTDSSEDRASMGLEILVIWRAYPIHYNDYNISDSFAIICKSKVDGSLKVVGFPPECALWELLYEVPFDGKLVDLDNQGNLVQETVAEVCELIYGLVEDNEGCTHDEHRRKLRKEVTECNRLNKAKSLVRVALEENGIEGETSDKVISDIFKNQSFEIISPVVF